MRREAFVHDDVAHEPAPLSSRIASGGWLLARQAAAAIIDDSVSRSNAPTPSGGTSLGGIRRRLLEEWDDLSSREGAAGVRAGDPIFLAPDYRVDPQLSEYGSWVRFRAFTTETKRNCATDIPAVSGLPVGPWPQQDRGDGTGVESYEHRRRQELSNPQRVGGSEWDWESAALSSLYGALVRRSPTTGRYIPGEHHHRPRSRHHSRCLA